VELAISLNCECGKDTKETLKNIKAAGFKAVMLSETAGFDCDILSKKDMVGEELEDTIRAAFALGLKIPNAHLGYSRDKDIYHECEERGLDFVRSTIKKLEILGRYKIPVAVIHPVSDSKPDTPLPGAIALRRMKEIVAAADINNVKLAVENLAVHDNEYLFYYLENIDSDYLGICFDAGHANNYPPRVDMLKTWGHKLFAIHLHDNYGGTEHNYDDKKDYHFLPFDGTINFKKVLREIAAAGWKGEIGLELHRVINKKFGVQKYDHMSPLEFLREARKRGETLCKMIFTKNT